MMKRSGPTPKPFLSTLNWDLDPIQVSDRSAEHTESMRGCKQCQAGDESWVRLLT